jgi:hypothetical protein
MVSTRIDVKPGEHMLILGRTQSGKSIFGTNVARGIDVGSLVVYDPKRDPDAVLPNCAVVRSADEVVRRLPGRVVWQPSRQEQGRLMAAWDRICARLLDLAEHGYSSRVLVHELADLADAHKIGPAFRQVITQGGKIAGGRERGGGHVGGIFISQRPRNIPVIARSEMQHVVCFALENAEDREDVASMMEDRDRPAESRRAVASFALPNDFSWWYRGPERGLTLHDPVALPH